jgi:3-deoxy-D-manno-octulosonic acid kinase
MSWIDPYATDPLLERYLPLPHPTARVLIHREYAAAADALGLLGAEPLRVAVVEGGRDSHPVLELPGGERVVVRGYRRGGFVRHFIRARYLRGNRAMEELRTTVHAAAGGVRAPLVIAAVERPAMPGYTASLVTCLIPQARELAAWLAGAEAPERLDVLRAAGEQISRMHTAGVAHPDLNLRNFLVSGSGSGKELWIIDFDRATTGVGPMPPRRRARDLLRLGRSVRKIGVSWGAAEGEALREGYGAAWPLTSLLG